MTKTQLIPMALILVCTACATTALDDHGRQVAIVTAMTASEVGGFEELGAVSCEEQTALYTDSSEICKNNLRNDAAARGATIVVIENSETTKCRWPNDKDDCIRIHGRAYRSRVAPAASPSPAK